MTELELAVYQLRWLVYKNNALKTKDLQSEMNTLAGAKLLRNDELKNFANTNSEKSEEELVQLIEQQEQLIFDLCLKKEAKNEKKPFSKTTFTNAVNLYKETMYKETLMQFETLCLIERYVLLTAKKERAKKDILNTTVTITYVIEPERHFIQAKIESSDLKDFKLRGTARLLECLADADFINTDEALEEFFSEDPKVNPWVDSDLKEAKTNTTRPFMHQMKPRSVGVYFNNQREELTTAASYLKAKIANIQEFAQIQLRPKPTNDERLNSLRDTVTRYMNQLETIELKERSTYEHRNESAILCRKALAENLEFQINNTETLSAELKQQIVVTIDKIKAAQPQWNELPLLDQIIDIISLGYTYRKRLVSFNSPVATNFYSLAEENNDQQDGLHN